MFELRFLSSRNVQSAIYESSLVLHAEKIIELGPCNVMREEEGVGVPRKQGVLRTRVLRTRRW